MPYYTLMDFCGILCVLAWTVNRAANNVHTRKCQFSCRDGMKTGIKLPVFDDTGNLICCIFKAFYMDATIIFGGIMAEETEFGMYKTI